LDSTKAILWDIDGTLLDFKAAQAASIRYCFRQFSLGPCSDAVVEDYDAINDRYWKLLELRAIDKASLLTERFRVFFRRHGLPEDVLPAFADSYEQHLGDTILFLPNALETLRVCRDRGLKQYAVTNGTGPVQKRKLKESGLSMILDGAFISDDIGFEKPDPRFFAAVFRALHPLSAAAVLLVGDSLTSDIRGAANAGIRSCWYRGYRGDAPAGPGPDLVIDDLAELPAILAAED